MECPKCGLEIDDKAMVCPNCKKVLKLACPICKTINTSNTCRKCGYVIITKCNNCGKINQTITKKCKKCGFDTEKSVVMNESNTDDFVMLTIDFPNMDEMKTHLGSAKLLNKFKVNLDKIILDYTKSIGLRRQLIGKTYVIRCDKDYTFNSSAATAVKTAIELLNRITAMNCKLTQKKNASIRCNMFLLKRSIDSDPNDYQSGFNISLLNQNAKTKETKILNTFQVLTDDEVSDALDAEYKVSPLNSVMINDEMVMFYEVDLREFVKVEYPEEEEEQEIEIPNFVQNMLVEQDKLDGQALNNLDSPGDPDAIYDIETINFDEINCEFMRTENIDVLFHILNKFQTIPKGILAIKTAELYKPYSLKVLNAAADTGKFNNIISLTCYDEMKYSPYSFFRDLVSAIFEYTVSQKLFFQNDFSMFASVDPDGLIRDLITLQQRGSDNTEDTRYVYFDIFLTLLQIIPKTLIFIEDFDKIDASSYDVLKFLFEAFEQLDISFLLTYNKDFSLHKDCHFLLSKPYYTEISLKPTPFEKMIEENKIYYRNILSNFYFQRIAKYSCGSILFIDIAIQYLIESGVYAADDDSIEMINPKTIIIPSNLDRLVARRLNLLQDDADAMKFLTSVVLLGTRIDMGTIESLGYENVNEIIEKLTNMGYMYQYNNCIYFPNYNLLRDNLLTTISKIYLKEVAEELFEKIFNPDMPSPVKAYLYGLLEDYDNERLQWEQLAQVNLSLGDFSSYLNCTNKILQILDKNNDPERQEEIDTYKLQLYENISNNLYEYVPDKTAEIAEVTLKNMEKSTDIDKIIVLCNKMINGSLYAGNYTHALELTHKVLSLLPPSSLNPNDENFNSYFFLMSMIHIQILFNIGALVDALDVGYKVLNIINRDTIDKLKPEYMSKEDFIGFVTDSVGYVALANVLLLVGNVQEFLKIVRSDLDFIPKSYDIFITLQDLLHGVKTNPTVQQIDANDRFGGVILHTINAFVNFTGDYKLFAEDIYRAKVIAKDNRLHQLELFCDLLIGYAYLQLESYKKADAIIYQIIKAANEKGMTTLLYVAWYVMSELHLRQHKYDVAFGIVNNSLIQLEKNNTTSEYLLMLFKYNMFKILMFKKQPDKAEICMGHAQYIAQKYGVNFIFDTDASHYIPIEEDNVEEAFTEPVSDTATIDDLL
ncbi:TPA: zinc ribbon domain-containing protein [Candidatus Gastranaerophilales bacterium HUM_20]|nr:putative uncharacterized protein [Clostridium sp. CAG:729]DAB20431.1 MAG TPA: zinc ribbon domain-containing protein [Candidatus Gastranaerophilales bacterium HUM_20]